MSTTQKPEPNSKPLTIGIPPSLYAKIENEARGLGLSIADVARLRLRTGHSPTLPIQAAAAVAVR
jgi:hypothetical protein